MNGRIEQNNKIENKTLANLSGKPIEIKEWFYYLKASNNSAHTCYDYVNKIIKFYTVMNISSYSNINYSVICEYLSMIKYKNNMNEEFSDSYKYCVWSALKNYITFLKNRDYIDRDYMKDIKPPKNHDIERINQQRKLLTKKDFTKLNNICKNDDSYNNFLSLRNNIIIMIFMTTGIRESAMSNINNSDINLDNKSLFIIDKGHKNFNYKLNDNIIDLLTKYFKLKKENNFNNDALFVNMKNQRFTSSGIKQMIQNYSKKALGYSISPHKIRSGFCSILYGETKNIEFVRRAVGHSNISTTQRYIVTKNNERQTAANIIGDIIS